MFDLSPLKILLIVAVILVVMGPDKLPEAARSAGRAWRGLRTWQQRIEKEIREAVPDLPSTADIARVVRSPVNLLNTLADRVPDEPAEEGAAAPAPAPPAPAYVPAPSVTNGTASEHAPPVGPAATNGSTSEPAPSPEPSPPSVGPLTYGDPSLN